MSLACNPPVEIWCMAIGKTTGKRLKPVSANAGKWPQREAMVSLSLTFPSYLSGPRGLFRPAGLPETL